MDAAFRDVGVVLNGVRQTRGICGEGAEAASDAERSKREDGNLASNLRSGRVGAQALKRGSPGRNADMARREKQLAAARGSPRISIPIPAQRIPTYPDVLPK